MAKTKAKNPVPHPHHVPIGVTALVGIVFLLTLSLLFVWNAWPRSSAPAPTSTEKIPVVQTPTTTPPLPSSPSQGEVTTPVRERPEGMICDDLNFICVDEKVENSLLSSPFIVTGSGIAFENTINWRLLDAKGQVLEKGFVTAERRGGELPGDFEIRAFILQVPTTSTGTLEVLEYSAKDGSPTHVVKIPVRLPQSTMTVKYFMPAGLDVNVENCTEVFPKEVDVVRSSLPIETSLRAMLAYVGCDNCRYGVPSGTELRSLVVKGGTATVVFSPELDAGVAGSCRVQEIRAQIEQTLLQFASVKNVVISVVGKTPAETLQP